MRTKTRGGRARLSKIPSPSPTSSPTPTPDTCSLPFPNLNPDEANGRCRIGRIAPETLSGRNSDDNMASADSDNDNETDNRAEMRGGLGPGGDGMEMDWLGESCIICDRGGGNVLVCSGTGCPIALHENCMNSGLKFDDAGNFYCPYCWYKREAVRTRELRKKAMEAKKVLLCFIDSKMADDDKGKKDCGRDEGKALNVSPHGGERNCGACVDRMDDDQVESEFVEVEDDQENDGDNAKLADSCDQHKMTVDHQNEPICDDHNLKKTPGVESSMNTTNKEGSSQENISESHEFEVLEDREKIQVEDSGQVDDGGNEGIVEDSLQIEPGTASGVQEENNVGDDPLHLAKQVVSDSVKVKQGRREDEAKMLPETSGTEISDSDAETILMHQKRVKQKGKRKAPQKVDLPKKLSSPLKATPKKVSRTRNEKVIASKRPRRQGVAAEKITNLAFYNEKRKRLHWTAEEEEMLKEGVQKFSTEVNKNLPWRKILEFGRHVFDPTRNPADLKDKWRNILAKKSSTANRS